MLSKGVSTSAIAERVDAGESVDDSQPTTILELRKSSRRRL